MNFSLRLILPTDQEAIAILLHRSLSHWYQLRLNQGHRFGESWKPFLLIPQVYEALDPGEGFVAENETGTLLGVCYLHDRPTHLAIGIVSTSPEAAGKGVAKALLQRAFDLATQARKPLRLVSSALNLDSYSLYNRLGFSPYTIYQDLEIAIPEQGFALASTPSEGSTIRYATPDDAERIAAFERSLRSIHRQKDFEFFLNSPVGMWKVLISEKSPQHVIEGFLVYSEHPCQKILGPGSFESEQVGLALLLKCLESFKGQSKVVLIQTHAHEMIRTFYQLGAKNVEIHFGQHAFPEGVEPYPEERGFHLATFLPESA